MWRPLLMGSFAAERTFALGIPAKSEGALNFNIVSREDHQSGESPKGARLEM